LQQDVIEYITYCVHSSSLRELSPKRGFHFRHGIYSQTIEPECLQRCSNISLEGQLEVLVTDSVYAFSRGEVVVIVTNSNMQHSVQLPVAPFAVGDSVCDVMHEQSQCVSVSSTGYSIAMTGEPKVMMRAPKV